MTLNVFQIDSRYHRVCQTSRANQNDLHLQKLEIIYIIDVPIVCKLFVLSICQLAFIYVHKTCFFEIAISKILRMTLNNRLVNGLK